MESKKCTKCKKYKTLDNFLKRKERGGAPCSRCKKCAYAARRQWYLENRAHEIRKASIYMKKHYPEFLAKSTKHRRKLRQEVLDKFGRACKLCGFTNEHALQIDHVFGHGCKELKNMGNGASQYLRRVLDDTKGRYQLLCANCNLIKYRTKGDSK